MAKRKKMVSVKLSVRLPADVHLVVQSMAESVGWSESKCVTMLLRLADAALHRRLRDVSNAKRELRIAAGAWRSVEALGVSRRVHAKATRNALAAAEGAKPPVDLDPSALGG